MTMPVATSARAPGYQKFKQYNCDFKTKVQSHIEEFNCEPVTRALMNLLNHIPEHAVVDEKTTNTTTLVN